VGCYRWKNEHVIRTFPDEQPVGRKVSIDAYRGFILLLMMAELLQLSSVAAAYPTSFSRKFAVQSDSCGVVPLLSARHDSAGVLFAVGVVLPYSIAGRTEKGTSASDIRLPGRSRPLYRRFVIGAVLFLAFVATLFGGDRGLRNDSRIRWKNGEQNRRVLCAIVTCSARLGANLKLQT
jgi:predicted acyltransferase